VGNLELANKYPLDVPGMVKHIDKVFCTVAGGADTSTLFAPLNEIVDVNKGITVEGEVLHGRRLFTVD